MIKFIALFLLILAPKICLADIKITEWKEFTKLTDKGKISTILFKGVIDIEDGYVINGYKIDFPDNRIIEVTNTTFDQKTAQFDFKENSLSFKFPTSKKNRDQIELSYTFKENRKVINQSIRQESVLIPESAKGADFQIAFDYGDSLEFVSDIINLKSGPGVMVFKGLVPENGLKKILKFTKNDSAWKVSVKNIVKFNNIVGNMTIKIPAMFQDGGQKIENRSVMSTISPIKSVTENKMTIMDFSILENYSKIIVETKADVFTGSKNRVPIIRDITSEYTLVDKEESEILKPIIQNIRADPQYQDIPMYIKIGKFVNQYIKYDPDFFGKNLKVKEILSSKKGVCAEYAVLFNALARVAGIPSSIVYGYALGEYEKFESHAWNMIYYNNSWIEVDPTWDLMSGAVSSSHIFLKENNREDIIIGFKGNKPDNPFSIDKRVDITPLEK